MKNTGKNPKPTDAKRDRRSGTGVSGSPKKGGHGGKFTWAGDADYTKAETHGLTTVIDAKDPNFEDPEEEVIETQIKTTD